MNNKKANQKDVLNYLKQCIPELLEKNECIFLEDQETVKVGKHTFLYYVIQERTLIILEKKIRNEKQVLTIITPRLKGVSRKKVKSKSGKAKTGKKLLFIFGMVSFLAITNAKDLSKEELKEIPIQTLTQDDLKKNAKIPLPKIKPSSKSQIIEVHVEVTPTDYLGFEKRKRTEEKYGKIISYYAKRRGIDESLLIDLFTRERYNEIDIIPESKLENMEKIYENQNIDTSEKIKENVGQLTRAICGEKIISPIFQNGKIVGYDKIFVLPPSYDKYNIEDLKDVLEKEIFEEEDRKKLQEAYKLMQEKDWQIYKRKDAFYEIENNINIATAYLSYLINKKQDLIKGVMSYNAGYTSVPDNISYDKILNGDIKAFDPYYITKILQYSPFKEGTYTCTIQFENEKTVIYQFHNTLELEEEYAKKNGYRLWR